MMTNNQDEDLVWVHQWSILKRGSLFGIVVNVLDCNIIDSEFKFLSRNYVHFQTWEKYVHLSIFTNPSIQAGYDTRSNFLSGV